MSGVFVLKTLKSLLVIHLFKAGFLLIGINYSVIILKLTAINQCRV